MKNTIKSLLLATLVFMGSAAVASAAEPTLTVTSPNGGEVWTIGSTQNITWNIQGEIPSYWDTNPSGIPNVIVLLYKNNSFVQFLSTQHVGGPSGFAVPDVTPGNDYKIRVSASGRGDIDLRVYDDSNTPFTITSNNPTIISFTSNNSTDGGYDFYWNTSGGDSTEFQIPCYSGLKITTHEGDFECGDVTRNLAVNRSYHLHFSNNSGNTINARVVLAVIKSGNRAVTKELNINIPSQPPKVDVKVKFSDGDPSDGPYVIPSGYPATIVWTSTNSTSCLATGEWSGIKATSGSELTQPITQNYRYYTITCYNGAGAWAQDSVTINVSATNPPTTTPPPAPAPTPTPTPTPPVNPNKPLPADVDTQNPQGACLDLQNNLRYRMRDAGTSDDISSLQDYLQANGYLHTEPTGFFGVLTLKAAKDFQQANGISPTGFVGPITRAKIKALSCQ